MEDLEWRWWVTSKLNKVLARISLLEITVDRLMKEGEPKLYLAG